MILPIYAYGQSVLKKRGEEIAPDYPQLRELIENMWETMYNAEGIGLAAPQIGLSIRLFMVDTTLLDEEGKDKEGIKKVFINAEVVEEVGEVWAYEEGCLSIPDVRGDVERPDTITLKYVDENFNEHIETFTEMNARVVQHEYDHIDGILFTELLKPIKKRLVKKKLENIKKGKTQASYKMKFPKTR
ncbi:MAG: peptide deformylase [Bacteroidota bacterium]